ncbi:ester cyclase [Amycolatopsis anabasis]|uniref:ester cyclase n=1 Tax=Amycolatopsis anabasis TaxID=1840409 RepID=UPI00131D2686|nr:ester cyclase [Amycolatopsis anabasis]
MSDRGGDLDYAALAVRIHDRLWNHGDLATVEGFCWPDLVAYLPEELDRDGFSRYVAETRAGLPDLAVHVHETVAERNQVLLRAHVTGTHRGPLLGLPPTGRPTLRTELVWYRFHGGRVACLWRESNPLVVLDQLGVVPPEDAGPFGRFGHSLRTLARMAVLTAKGGPKWTTR